MDEYLRKKLAKLAFSCFAGLTGLSFYIAFLDDDYKWETLGSLVVIVTAIVVVTVVPLHLRDMEHFRKYHVQEGDHPAPPWSWRDHGPAFALLFVLVSAGVIGFARHDERQYRQEQQQAAAHQGQQPH